ncbi:hypothetical protein SAMN02910377_01923 [Pseudobutyrivibrio ruminis]|uniref:Glycosyltransferase 2-like domain-containing protein n=1 Tax=Pseudobutyrivibrio ruminis TaxID=46206 RepID=A0A1H7K8K8_9FIRM|nr:hypothetical protein [Pseudobutyrivibrio ruminis]SEK82820.1 hypothetical protein SAMN02910377_01923 [Pseudobutyrivibrio ruminis]
MRTPIAIFTYNRLECLEKMIDSLKLCNNVNQHKIYIFSDAANPQKQEDYEKVNRVRNYLLSVKNKAELKSVNLIFADKHKGCAKSIIEGLNYVFETSDRVIDIEDDLILANDFLDFIDEGLDKFQNDYRIWSISGFIPPLEAFKEYKKSTFMGERATSWGFGIWKDRWNLVDWNMTWYSSLKNNRNELLQFGDWGYDLPEMLMNQAEKFIDAWDIITCYTQYIHKMLTVFPVKSKSFNIGVIGTHYNGENVFQQDINLSPQYYSFDDIEYSYDISSERKSLYSTKSYLENLDYYSNENKYKCYYLLLSRWINNLEITKQIERFFDNEECRRIAIYGHGNLGEAFFNEIKKIDALEFVCYIERKANIIENTVSVNEIPDVDAIVVTPFMEYYDIKESLKDVTDARIYSLWEII